MTDWEFWINISQVIGMFGVMFAIGYGIYIDRKIVTPLLDFKKEASAKMDKYEKQIESIKEQAKEYKENFDRLLPAICDFFDVKYIKKK